MSDYNWVEGDPSRVDLTPDESQIRHDSYYSNREQQIEYLQEEGYSDEEIKEILAEDAEGEEENLDGTVDP